VIKTAADICADYQLCRLSAWNTEILRRRRFFGLLDKIGLPRRGSCGQSISVRDDLMVTYELIAAGVPEYDKTKGEYVKMGQHVIANDMPASLRNHFI
jgi:hypothetical protein